MSRLSPALAAACTSLAISAVHAQTCTDPLLDRQDNLGAARGCRDCRHTLRHAQMDAAGAVPPHRGGPRLHASRGPRAHRVRRHRMGALMAHRERSQRGPRLAHRAHTVRQDNVKQVRRRRNPGSAVRHHLREGAPGLPRPHCQFDHQPEKQIVPPVRLTVVGPTFFDGQHRGARGVRQAPIGPRPLQYVR